MRHQERFSIKMHHVASDQQVPRIDRQTDDQHHRANNGEGNVGPFDGCMVYRIGWDRADGQQSNADDVDGSCNGKIGVPLQ